MVLSFLRNPAELGHASFDAVVAEPRTPEAIQLLTYWRSKGIDGQIPSRTSIKPREIVKLLPNVFIAEPTGDDWRFRLVGTSLSSYFRAELSGKTLRTIYKPETADQLTKAFDAVAARREPINMRGRFLGVGIDSHEAEGLILPILAPDGRTVFVFGGVFFVKPAARASEAA